MYGDSLDALRALLHSQFSDVTRIYVSTMPDSFVRPSFFVNLGTSNEEHLSRSMYLVDTIWQIVYFAPMDEKHQVDVFDQLQVSEQLKQVFMDTMSLVGPKGTVYHIIETEGGPRDAEVYITVSLQTEITRPREQFGPMLEVHHTHKEG